MATVESSAKRTVHPAIKIWFIVHFLMILLWSMPNAAPAVRAGKQQGNAADQLYKFVDLDIRSTPVGSYLIATGLWQYWDMFAPNPLSVDFYLDAVVEYADGSVQKHTYPRMAELDIPAKYVHERFRKYGERAHAAENQFLWPQFAYRIASYYTKDVNNLPVKVTLIRYFREVGPVGKDPKPWQYQVDPYYVYVVDQNRILKEKGWQ